MKTLTKDVLISTEMSCCDGLPMLVKMPETLTCQVCSLSYMNLVTGVQSPFVGVKTVHNNYQ